MGGAAVRIPFWLRVAVLTLVWTAVLHGL